MDLRVPRRAQAPSTRASYRASHRRGELGVSVERKTVLQVFPADFSFASMTALSTMPGASKVNDQWGSTAFTDVHRRPRMELSRNDRPSVNSGGVQ